MGAKNCVIAGDYDKKAIVNTVKGIYLVLGFTKKILLNKDSIEEYEVVDEENNTSVVSAAGRGLAGSLLLGGVGLVAGALSAKKKGIHIIAIQFKDGKKSLIEIDDKLYKELMKVMF